MERTLEQIQQEHNQIAFQLGIASYRKKCEEVNIERLLVKLMELNEEGAKHMKEKKENEARNAEPVQAVNEAPIEAVGEAPNGDTAAIPSPQSVV